MQRGVDTLVFIQIFRNTFLQMGADALITSVHKALPGYSASALLLAKTQYLNAERLEQSFETTHTTSPAGAPLASIDATRALLQTRGSQNF
jgi:arginine decarboxylase